MDTLKSPPSAKRNPGNYSAPALEKGFNVIELLAKEPEGLTISEIAARLGHRNISEIFRVIMVMQRRGWVLKQAGSDRICVTYKVLRLAFAATPAKTLIHVAAPHMYDLSAELDQSCHLVVIADTKGLVVHRQENPGPTGFAVRQGTDIDLLHSCSGAVLMAFSEDEITEALLAAYPPLSDRDLANFHRHRAAVRERGHEFKPSARTLGVTDISYPIFGRNRQLLAALTVPFLQLIDGSQLINREDARARIGDYATQISYALGGTSD